MSPERCRRLLRAYYLETRAQQLYGATIIADDITEALIKSRIAYRDSKRSGMSGITLLLKPSERSDLPQFIAETSEIYESRNDSP